MILHTILILYIHIYQFQTQEDDREFLIKQLVAIKKDNAKLKQSIETKDINMKAAQDELEKMKKNKGNYVLMGGVKDEKADFTDNELPTPLGMDIELKYKGIVKRLKVAINSVVIFFFFQI